MDNIAELKTVVGGVGKANFDDATALDALNLILQSANVRNDCCLRRPWADAARGDI